MLDYWSRSTSVIPEMALAILIKKGDIFQRVVSGKGDPLTVKTFSLFL